MEGNNEYYETGTQPEIHVEETDESCGLDTSGSGSGTPNGFDWFAAGLGAVLALTFSKLVR